MVIILVFPYVSDLSFALALVQVRKPCLGGLPVFPSNEYAYE